MSMLFFCKTDKIIILNVLNRDLKKSFMVQVNMNFGDKTVDLWIFKCSSMNQTNLILVFHADCIKKALAMIYIRKMLLLCLKVQKDFVIKFVILKQTPKNLFSTFKSNIFLIHVKTVPIMPLWKIFIAFQMKKIPENIVIYLLFSCT